MDPPLGYGNGDSVWLLLEGFYGLKQAGRILHKQLKADMEGLGHKSSLVVYPERAYHPIVLAPRINVEDCMVAVAMYVALCQLDRVVEMFQQK